MTKQGFSPISCKDETVQEFRQLQRTLSYNEDRDIKQDEMLRILLDTYKKKQEEDQKAKSEQSGWSEPIE